MILFIKLEIKQKIVVTLKVLDCLLQSCLKENYSTEESCELLLTKSKNGIIDVGLHFVHVLKSLYKIWGKK